jgi:hypothetical protein
VCIHLMYERPVDRKRGEDLFCQKFDYSKRWGPDRPGSVVDHRTPPDTRPDRPSKVTDHRTPPDSQPDRPGKVTDHRTPPDSAPGRGKVVDHRTTPTSQAGSCEISGSLKGDKKEYSTQVSLYLQDSRQPVMSVKASSGAYSFGDVKAGQYRVVPNGKYPNGRLSIGPNPSFRNVICQPNQRHHVNFSIQSLEG